MESIRFTIGSGKNILNKTSNGTWIGFTGYRYHWAQKNILTSDNVTQAVNKDNFESFILKQIPDEWQNYDVILGEKCQLIIGN